MLLRVADVLCELAHQDGNDVIDNFSKVCHLRIPMSLKSWHNELAVGVGIVNQKQFGIAPSKAESKGSTVAYKPSRSG